MQVLKGHCILTFTSVLLFFSAANATLNRPLSPYDEHKGNELYKSLSLPSVHLPETRLTLDNTPLLLADSPLSLIDEATEHIFLSAQEDTSDQSVPISSLPSMDSYPLDLSESCISKSLSDSNPSNEELDFFEISSRVWRKEKQDKHYRKTPSSNSSDYRAPIELKASLEALLQMRNPFDSQGKFFSLEEIASIIHTEAIIFNKPLSPTTEALRLLILKDQELKELYNKTNAYR